MSESGRKSTGRSLQTYKVLTYSLSTRGFETELESFQRVIHSFRTGDSSKHVNCDQARLSEAFKLCGAPLLARSGHTGDWSSACSNARGVQPLLTDHIKKREGL